VVPSVAPRPAGRSGPGAEEEARGKARRKRCLVFCATRHTVDLVVPVLHHAGLLAAAVHGNMDQQQRTSALDALKSRDIEVLVVTDVAARGLDVPLLDCVINYDFPPTPKLFVHRAGRVGRAGTSGTCHSLVTAQELPYLLDTSVFLGHALATDPPGAPDQGNPDAAPSAPSAPSAPAHPLAHPEIGAKAEGADAGRDLRDGGGEGADAAGPRGVEVTVLADGDAGGGRAAGSDNFLVGTAPFKYLVSSVFALSVLALKASEVGVGGMARAEAGPRCRLAQASVQHVDGAKSRHASP